MNHLTALLAAALLMASTFSCRAELAVEGIFCDNMVLQQGMPVPVWGLAEPGQTVCVEFSGHKKSIRADASGRWCVTLDPLPASSESRTLRIISATAGNQHQLTFTNLLVGEVWFCSGQSNMAMTMGEIPAGAVESALPQDPTLRVFSFRRQFDALPVNAISNGFWYGMDSNRVRGVSATAYFLGRSLQRELKVPVGLIVSAWGGTPVEAWMSREMLAGDPETDAIARKGLAASLDWMKTNEVFLAAGGDPKKQPWPDWRLAQTPTWLFNGMVNPFTNYAIRGVIWYQGEHNVSDPEPYGKMFPAMIKGWRLAWGRNFPFYFCQLPGIKLNSNDEGKLALLRTMQARALALPDTGMAVLYDTAEENDNHPKNKQAAGERLAFNALAGTYGRVVEYSGPAFSGMDVDGNKLRLRFEHKGGGLVAHDVPLVYRPVSTKSETKPVTRKSPGSQLEGFEVRGEDGVWHWATGRIDCDTVLVWSEKVAKPVAVRYGWADFGFFNLFNAEGLPAPPFVVESSH